MTGAARVAFLRRAGIQFFRQPDGFFSALFPTAEDQHKFLPWMEKHRTSIIAALMRQQAHPGWTWPWDPDVADALETEFLIAMGWMRPDYRALTWAKAYRAHLWAQMQEHMAAVQRARDSKDLGACYDAWCRLSDAAHALDRTYRQSQSPTREH